MSHLYRIVKCSGISSCRTYSVSSNKIIPWGRRGCCLYRSSHAGCRFGRSGSNGFVGGFRHLRLSNCVPVPKVRSCRDWCRDRYIYHPVGFPIRGDCHPKQIRFPLRGRLKNGNRARASRAHPTSGLKVLCGLGLALIIKLESFC